MALLLSTSFWGGQAKSRRRGWMRAHCSGSATAALSPRCSHCRFLCALWCCMWVTRPLRALCPAQWSATCPRLPRMPACGCKTPANTTPRSSMPLLTRCAQLWSLGGPQSVWRPQPWGWRMFQFPDCVKLMACCCPICMRCSACALSKVEGPRQAHLHCAHHDQSLACVPCPGDGKALGNMLHWLIVHCSFQWRPAARKSRRRSRRWRGVRCTCARLRSCWRGS